MNHTPSAAVPQRSSPGASAPTTVDGPASRFSKASAAAVLVCWLLVVFDGYDLIVYGTVQSSLISETGWGLSKATAGTIGSMAFLGMKIAPIIMPRKAMDPMVPAVALFRPHPVSVIREDWTVP